MLDRDLADLYGIETRTLKQAVKRNKKRFPSDFMFILTEKEVSAMVSQTVIPSRQHLGGSLPYAFTEQGVAMLSSVLKSEKAIEVNIRLMRAFVAMRRFLQGNAEIFQRMALAEQKLLLHDTKFDQVFKLIASKELPEKGIFFDGQVFDAYKFVVDLIKSAQKSILLIDPFVDESVLVLFSKRKVPVTIYTHLTKQLRLDMEKFNAQYGSIVVKEFSKSHDRFLIIDDEVYHFGASLKDLGKKWFAFSKFGKGAVGMLEQL